MSDSSEQADPAAIFACAHSLWNACHRAAETDSSLNLSECYHGMDQLMRVIMSIGGRFEAWSCANIDFDALEDVWPYLMDDKFGEACLRVLLPVALDEFDDDDCLRVALRLRLPVKVRDGLHVPVDVTADNPVPGSLFASIRIQTVRHHLEDDQAVPFTLDDDPFDADFGPVIFSLYGIGSDGLPEHVADRRSFGEAASLARKLSPGIAFDATAIASDSASGRLRDPLAAN